MPAIEQKLREQGTELDAQGERKTGKRWKHRSRPNTKPGSRRSSDSDYKSVSKSAIAAPDAGVLDPSEALPELRGALSVGEIVKRG